MKLSRRRTWGVSVALKRELDRGCAEICFVDLRSAAPDSAVAQPQRVWVEAFPRRMALAKDFDGIIWVRHVHPQQMPLSALLAWCSPGYWWRLSVVLLAMLLGALCILWVAKAIQRRRFSLRASIRT